ncbi:carboxymuconolactone decarboxylase family protein [Streptomyces sp. NPDC046324]|uniref:carboxymuconolactone decarboxylase family protein n=1 Tax=Streptomyces sp. NPDC046324 TaxID=3154915 RepID=UPI003407A91D
MEARLKLFENLFASGLLRRAIAAAGQAVKGSPTPAATRELAALRGRRSNGCIVCDNTHTNKSVVAGGRSVRLNLVMALRTAMVLTEAKRASLKQTETGQPERRRLRRRHERSLIACHRARRGGSAHHVGMSDLPLGGRQPAERDSPAARRRSQAWAAHMTSPIRPLVGGDMTGGRVVVVVQSHPLSVGDWLSA